MNTGDMTGGAGWVEPAPWLAPARWRRVRAHRARPHHLQHRKARPRFASPPPALGPSWRSGPRSPIPTTRSTPASLCSHEPCTAGTASAQDCLPVYFTQFVGGTAPDVWRVDDEPLPFYAEKNMYRELDPYVARNANEVKPDDFFPRAIAAIRYD